MRRAPLITLALAGATLLASLPTWAGAEADLPVCDQRAPTFRPAIRLGNGFGYEPSIETDSKGTIYVMAHKLSLAAEGSGASARTASWLWRSTDDGRTFSDMAGLSGATNLAYALEGDGAVDAMDRFYYVDTWVTENAEPDPNNLAAEPGIYDVKSGAEGLSMEGTPYTEWD